MTAHALTHVHPDHQGSSHAICERLGIPLWCGQGDVPAMETPGGVGNSQAPGWLNRLQDRFWAGPPHPVARALKEGDEVAGFTVLETPGPHARSRRLLARIRPRADPRRRAHEHERARPASPGLHEPLALFTPDPARNRESARRLAELRAGARVLRPRRRRCATRASWRSSSRGCRIDDAMSESIFIPDGERLHPDRARARTVGSAGAARRRAGGADRRRRSSGWSRARSCRIARLGFEFLRPIPFAPLTLSTRIVRAGRRVQELAGELTSRGRSRSRRATASSSSVARARCACRRCRRTFPSRRPPRARVLRTAGAAAAARRRSRCASRSTARATRASRRARWRCAGSATPARSVRGECGCACATRCCPASRRRRWRAWPRPPTSATASARRCRSTSFLFINADLTIHLHRPPRGEWIGLDARTLLHGGGTGLAESVLHDVRGPVGRAFQTLVVQPR